MTTQHQLLRLPDVIRRTGLSRSSIYNLVKQERFPKALKLSSRTVAWLESDIADWIDSKIQKAKGGGCDES